MEELFDQPEVEEVKASKRSWRVIGRRVLMGVLVTVFLTIVGSYLLWRAEPGYWVAGREKIKQTPVESLDQMAVRAEQGYIGFINAENQGKWRAKFVASHDQINAWLSRRLRAWLAHQDMALPEAIDELMVWEDGGELVVGFRLKGADINQVFSLYFDLGVSDDGKLDMVCTEIYGGNLRLPSNAIEKLLVKNSRGRGKKQVEMLLPLLEGQTINLFGNGKMRMIEAFVSVDGVRLVGDIGR